ncbi:hypothetical protein WR25_24453 isoform B [Diploscapter pachys]|nr:hypothetical protein WR25_24453 isoform B [Diploscapter pachys]
MSFRQFLSTNLVRATSISDAAFDGVILVASGREMLSEFKPINNLTSVVQNFLEVHKGALNLASLVQVDPAIIPSGRLILSGTGPVTRDYDDVRRFQKAGKEGAKLALKVGLRSPLLVTLPHPRFPNAELVSALGALTPIYTPLNVREATNKTKFEQMGILQLNENSKYSLVDLVAALDASFTVSRDIGDQGPERMTPPRVAEYVKHAFDNSIIKVQVEDNQQVIEKEYPLMAAVNRAANTIERHQARLIRLEYSGEGEAQETLFLIGKGVTLDTGGCDLKISGHMHGMCRDKYGSAVVAGFFKALEILKPKGVKVIGYMCMVRNSIGENAYTTDEVLMSRSGKRIHIYNTDAEGRLTMLDPLTQAKEEALNAKNPHVFTLATLTGHEVLSYGYYAAIMDNGPAKKSGWSRRIQEIGDEFGQPIEISRLHPEDFAFMEAECEQADLRQGNTKPSTQTLRGHQAPGAFLMMGSRIDEHGNDSPHPLKFSHMDLGSCQGDHPDTSFPNPLLTLVAGMCNRPQILETQLARKLSELNQASNQLAMDKAKLQENLRNVRNSIEEEFSRIIEMVREKERQLLNEADILAVEKENILEKQQLEVYQATETCQHIMSSLYLCEDVTNSGFDFLDKVSEIDLSPKAQGNIELELNLDRLYEDVSNLGSVTWVKEKSTKSILSDDTGLDLDLDDFSREFEIVKVQII